LEDREEVCVLQLQVRQANPQSSSTLVTGCRATAGGRVQITEVEADQEEDKLIVVYDCHHH